MSSYSEAKEDAKQLALMLFFGTIINKILFPMMIIGGIFLCISYSLFYVFFWVMPETELPRTKDGDFIVSYENYRDWGVHSKIWNSPSKVAMMTDEFQMVALPTAIPTCEGIAICEKYKSQFMKSVFGDGSKVVLIKPTFYSLVETYMERFDSAITDYNRELRDAGLDAEISFRRPGYGFEYEELSSSNKNNLGYEKLAISNCKVGMPPCNVKLRVDYKVMGFPYTSLSITD